MFGLGTSKKTNTEKYVAPDVNLTIDQQIETLLFLRGDEVGIGELAQVFGLKKKELQPHIDALENRLNETGSALMLVQNETSVLLTTRSEAAPLIESLQKNETEGPLSPAALEVLTIILYKSPVNRSEIDYIRGVNSTYSLRNLTIRGLVTRQGTGSGMKYIPTTDALRHLGISKKADLPSYTDFEKKLSELSDQSKEEYGKEESQAQVSVEKDPIKHKPEEAND